ncbi:MAG: metallophosphoesterase family protein [Acidobacteriota bacterium]
MQVGIISDIHDNIWKLELALRSLQAVDVLVCCGDLCSPFIVDQLARGFSRGPIHVVFGNNDGDRFRISLRAAHYKHFHLHGEFVELSLDGCRFAINHFDNIGRALAKSDAYDVVCYGHNHQFELEREGQTLKINPGEIMGGLSSGQLSTFVVYDTESGEALRREV